MPRKHRDPCQDQLLCRRCIKNSCTKLQKCCFKHRIMSLFTVAETKACVASPVKRSNQTWNVSDSLGCCFQPGKKSLGVRRGTGASLGGAESLLIHLRFLYTSQLTVTNSYSGVLAPCLAAVNTRTPLISQALLFQPPRRRAAH